MATILIVDDEAPVRGFLSAVLVDDGYEVRVAIHGAQALQLMERERPDLVISDVMMPVLDGRELCQRLKADEATLSIPIILMTSAGQQTINGAGHDAFLAKPFDLVDLEALLRRWLPQEPPSAA